MKSVADKTKGLPTDLAINRDYYLHGQPKRQWEGSLRILIIPWRL
jgi:hypothetical protein